MNWLSSVQFSSVQSLSHVWLFAIPWITARQASLSISNSQSSPKLMSIESVMPFSHLIFCRPLLLLPLIPPSIRVFSNESTLHMRWPKSWSFSFSISSPNEYFWVDFLQDWLGTTYLNALDYVLQLRQALFPPIHSHYFATKVLSMIITLHDDF